MFADDDTENVHDSDVEELKQKIQKEANNATEWVNDNKMVCAGNKTKLLLIGTPQLKHKKFEEHTNFSIDVDGTAVTNSESEPLLGLVVNDRLNWSNYVRGSDSNSGLIAQLSKRIGLLKKVVKVMPTARFRQVANGLFHSKLVYCLHVFGNVWGLADQDDQNRKCSTFTKSDNQKLQVLQNQVLRMIAKTKMREISTVNLLSQTNSLSVHQLTAFQTLTSVQKLIFNKRPSYFYKKLVPEEKLDSVQTRQNMDLVVPEAKLTQTRGGYRYRASKLWNKLPRSLKVEMKPETFRTLAKSWVSANISVKPD